MKTILIVEDVFSLRQSLAELMKVIAPGWAVHTASDGQRGYEKAVEVEPDLILADHQMPIMSGASMVKLIRKTPRIDNTPIALMSAINDDYAYRDLMALGDWCVQKPIQLQQVRSLVKAIETQESVAINPYYTATPPLIHNFP